MNQTHLPQPQPAQHCFLTEALKKEALRLGFALVGVTTPASPPHYNIYERWIEAGRNGNMAYLASERARQCRADPNLILPECQSIVVLGMPYFPSLPTTGSAISQGIVASYAWGADYHDVLITRLSFLVAFLENQVGHSIPNRWYTDNGPLLERDLAQRAGLGWIGKNTCLIHPRLGSYFFLAEILLGIELEPDQPFSSDHCGSCTRCLQACPTGCILENRTLDAQRCISYLTIELKDSIPTELRPHTGSWIFGCDICQQVCPWNKRFAHSSDDPAFSPRPGIPQPYLLEEIKLTPHDFSRKFKGSPVKRAKWAGYLRNVTTALGNAGRLSQVDNGFISESVSLLTKILSHEPQSMLRCHAAWALGRFKSLAIRQVLQDALRSESDPLVRQEIQLALDKHSQL